MGFFDKIFKKEPKTAAEASGRVKKSIDALHIDKAMPKQKDYIKDENGNIKKDENGNIKIEGYERDEFQITILKLQVSNFADMMLSNPGNALNSDYLQQMKISVKGLPDSEQKNELTKQVNGLGQITESSDFKKYDELKQKEETVAKEPVKQDYIMMESIAAEPTNPDYVDIEAIANKKPIAAIVAEQGTGEYADVADVADAAPKESNEPQIIHTKRPERLNEPQTEYAAMPTKQSEPETQYSAMPSNPSVKSEPQTKYSQIKPKNSEYSSMPELDKIGQTMKNAGVESGGNNPAVGKQQNFERSL